VIWHDHVGWKGSINVNGDTHIISRHDQTLKATFTVEALMQTKCDNLADFTLKVTRQSQCALQTRACYLKRVPAGHRIGMIELARKQTGYQSDGVETDARLTRSGGIHDDFENPTNEFKVVEFKSKVGDYGSNEQMDTFDDRVLTLDLGHGSTSSLPTRKQRKTGPIKNKKRGSKPTPPVRRTSKDPTIITAPTKVHIGSNSIPTAVTRPM
jgi:hypothetical protein